MAAAGRPARAEHPPRVGRGDLCGALRRDQRPVRTTTARDEPGGSGRDETAIASTRAAEAARLDTPVPPGQRKVVTTRFENTRDGLIFFREVTWDGRVVRIVGGNSSQKTPHLVDQTPARWFQKHGEKYATVEEARAAFERQLATDQRNFKSHTTKATFLPQLEPQAKHVSDPQLEAAFERASPESRAAAAQVYADWLLGQGDLRGEARGAGSRVPRSPRERAAG